MLGGVFLGLAQAVSAAVGAPFVQATLWRPGTPVTDAGGSIVTPGTPTETPCLAQFDAVTDAMRAEAGYVDRDVRLLILGAPVDTSAMLVVASGDHAGRWSIQSVGADPAGVGAECRGRR